MDQFGVTEVMIAAGASLLTFLLIKLIDTRLGHKRAQRILDQAQQQANNDAANRLREADLEIKERSLAAEQELSGRRDELHAQQRELVSQEETLTHQSEDLRNRKNSANPPSND